MLLGAILFFVPPARSDDLASRIDQDLKIRIAKKQFSLKVLVARGDSVLIRREYGVRNHRSSKGVRDNFPVGAIAEQFVAAAILHLEERGKIKIDAPICSYLSGV